MSQNELMQMAGNTKFGFLKLPASKAVFSEGDICQQLFFLVSGQLLLTTRSADGGYSLTEHIAAPWMMQPEVLFGLQPRYSSTCTTATLCHLITLSKDEVSRLAEQFLVVRLNLLNLLSTKMQGRAGSSGAVRRARCASVSSGSFSTAPSIPQGQKS